MDIFLRLREERKRLGFSQEALAEIGGVQKRAQVNYEKPLDDGGRKPDSAYLAAIAAAGADVQYILTGVRSGDAGVGAIAADESELLADYRSMDATGKKAMKALGKVYSQRKGGRTDNSPASAPVTQAVKTVKGAMVGVGSVGNVTYSETGSGNGKKGKK